MRLNVICDKAGSMVGIFHNKSLPSLFEFSEPDNLKKRTFCTPNVLSLMLHLRKTVEIVYASKTQKLYSYYHIKYGVKGYPHAKRKKNTVNHLVVNLHVISIYFYSSS